MQEQKLTGYPSIDKPWLKYYTEEAINNVPLKMAVYENIYESNKDYPNDTARLFFGKRITYEKILLRLKWQPKRSPL